jgi:hypothetical protein
VDGHTTRQREEAIPRSLALSASVDDDPPDKSDRSIRELIDTLGKPDQAKAAVEALAKRGRDAVPPWAARRSRATT